MIKTMRLVKRIFNSMRLYFRRKYALKVEGKNLTSVKLQMLTKKEKELLKQHWGKLGLRIYEDFYRVYKTMEKFNPQYLSDDLYYPYILRTLNPIEYSVALCHKAFYDNLFSNATLPETYVKRIRGTFYDRSCNVITENEAIDIVIGKPSFIIKPTIDTCVGKNVHKITDPMAVNILQLFDSVGNDFIVQEVVEQSEQTAKLNPSSLNTIRVSSLYINGTFSICNMCIKMGRNGAVVDNLGAGGLILGVHNDGTLYNYAYDGMYNKHYKNGKCVFEGIRIDGIDKVTKLVEKLHISHLPQLSFVGWDIALNKYNEPILVEVNLKWPGIQFEQLCCAKPLFGDRTDEVIDFVIQNNKR